MRPNQDSSSHDILIKIAQAKGEAMEDDLDVLHDTVNMIAEGEHDRDNEPAAGSVAAPARGATPVIGGRSRTSDAPTQATEDFYRSAQIIKLANKFFFANKIRFFANFVAFSPSGVSFSPVSTFTSLRQSS